MFERTAIRVLVAIGMALASAEGLYANQAKSGVKSSKPAAKPATASRVLAVVNGEQITDTELDRFFESRQVVAERRPELRERSLNQLIDARLVRQFLVKRDSLPDKKLVEEEFERIVKRGGTDERTTTKVAKKEESRASGTKSESQAPSVDRLASSGFTPESLRAELTLAMSWRIHVGRVVTPERVRKHFDEHRAEFDGTQVRARQILLTVETARDSEELAAAEARLTKMRSEIEAGKLTFADAARQHSQAASAEQGGDVGWFPFRGKMPEEFSRAAFALKPGEIGLPFRSRFGVHLVTATECKPGDLVLEDVRSAVLSQLSEELWRTTVAELRAEGKIERKGMEN
jgi:parvulin-like peptidyl-prolyl isomerase